LQNSCCYHNLELPIDDDYSIRAAGFFTTDEEGYNARVFVEIPLEKQPVPGYPAFPITVGEHIRKKRMDLGLLQMKVAEIIGVTESSTWNWGHGTEPEEDSTVPR